MPVGPGQAKGRQLQIGAGRTAQPIDHHHQIGHRQDIGAGIQHQPHQIVMTDRIAQPPVPLPAAIGLADFPKLPELMKLKGDAAKGTQKAFESVTDKIKSALEKIPGLFSPSKVTAEDMALSKAGLYQDKPDEILRQVQAAADDPDKNKNRFAEQIAKAREALADENNWKRHGGLAAALWRHPRV